MIHPGHAAFVARERNASAGEPRGRNPAATPALRIPPEAALCTGCVQAPCNAAAAPAAAG